MRPLPRLACFVAVAAWGFPWSLAASPAPPPPTAVTPAPVEATVDVVGLVRSPAPSRSVAILRSGGRTRVVGIGESAFGVKLIAIGTDTATLETDGRAVERRLTQAVPLPALPSRAAQTSTAPGEPREDPATPAREMDRRQVQARLGDEMNRILAETAIAPVMEDGHVVGVQLTRVPEGSLLTDAGLRAGDVVTRINDTQIDGMGTLIGLWPRLQNASELSAVVLRGGQPVSLHVALR